LIADHHCFSREDALKWRFPVIVSADDFGDESEPWNQSMVAATANTTYRSPSLPNCLLNVDEKKHQKTFAPRAADVGMLCAWSN
jgi:hypothetical protein